MKTKLNFTFSDRVLTAEEEISLSKILCTENPDSDIYKNALNTMMECNLKLVAKEAFRLSKKSKKSEKSGENYRELINEGVIGLVSAIKRFDPEKHQNIRFATYAVYWINKQMYDFLCTVNLIHVPRKVSFQYRQYKKLTKDKLHDITKEEAKEQLKLSDSELKLIEKANITITSLSSLVHEDNTNSNIMIQDVLREKNILSPDMELMIKDRDRVIQELMSSLDEVKKDIIMSHCMSNDKSTLQVLADKYGLSRERVRQIQEEILHDFKTKIKKMDLRKFYEE